MDFLTVGGPAQTFPPTFTGSGDDRDCVTPGAAINPLDLFAGNDLHMTPKGYELWTVDADPPGPRHHTGIWEGTAVDWR